ncbi:MULTISPECIES: sigma 54-interacting transcriptional regulator [Bacillaceae]|uniref:Sigma 54-interacting transcriptional regulator n=1 Tax=Evansella alkalicola TaxID=745819 RepID=A0ABS6JZS1_9BACI|nr:MULTISPECIES: sigma 54-interacting transcriptional regulator [Bacillaceae]MBU9724097.1 sigma 54-interacting transcriptional regulator [Bacillus alkalicola]
MKRVLLIGAGDGGASLLDVLKETKQFVIVGVVDKLEDTAGIRKAKDYNIPVFKEWKDAFHQLTPIDIVIEVTGNRDLYEEIRLLLKDEPVTLIPSSIASVMFYLIDEKKSLIEEVTRHNTLMDSILNSTHDGMIAIDLDHQITLLNKRAEEISGLKSMEVIGEKIENVMQSSKLPRVLKTGKAETNRRQILANKRKILTTRVPLYKNSQLTGALGVFRDITEIVDMAEEVTNLKSIQEMLEAIIESSDDAISVVDEKGKGILINPAYTRLTGLTKEDVIGHPATTDISEGESMHMHVLKTGKPVRGAKMKVGPNRKDVIVNVAPVIVDGNLKGSVGVIHDMSEIEALNTELEKAKHIIRTLEAKYSFDDIIGRSEGIQVAIQQAKQAAVTPVTILLQGESGTGKELFAHAIHNASKRKFNKFIRVNCAAISETLLESELFGYEEGAFSGAKRGGKKGIFEEADKGSVFLDEIGEISPQTQAKLLRVLQEKEIVRVGGTKAVPIDVRIIAATNVDIEQKIARKEFRSDLYHRLNRMPIFIPPLKKRKEDIPILCKFLLIKLNQDYGRSVEDLHVEAMEWLMEYDWPGNVRELENILGRAMIYMHYREKRIDSSHLPSLRKNEIQKQEPSWVHMDGGPKKTLQEVLDDTERNLILDVLKENNGNKTKTAKQLGVSIRNFYYKLEKYKIIQ